MTARKAVTAGVLSFLGVTAVGGGVAILVGATPPSSWLDNVPLISGWTIPGLVLALGFGAGSLLVTWGVLRGLRWSRAAVLLDGLGLVVWIALEIAYLPQTSWLQWLYAAAGLALLLLAAVPNRLAALPNRREPCRR
ncbi:hypothetical protein [Paractinoplanes durhamensis]|uniref:Uncharacterized protein n=1 Tax=Paractinoplanes durhamensis TaxID=113563 RepID=A0ABQ3YZQ4_9ACTN|nr:hypothetical protein [Actinoplanes durhamensis]GIE03010.1 hypothetical protein Adu01nite_43600 [Actinoplanes durhamensis]